MKVLVSGSSSGLGMYLKKIFNAESFNRGDVPSFVVNTLYYDMVIHCSSDPNMGKNSVSSDKYVEDSLLITKYLLQLNCDYFVFISSVDVYPSESNCIEDEEIKYSDLKGRYSKSKFKSEEMVRRSTKRTLILRPVAMLGTDIRQNSLLKMLNNREGEIFLSRKSVFNYVLHKDIGLFLQYCFIKKVQGVFNIASIENITLGEVQEKFNLKNINFGDYFYKTGKISTEKLSLECSFFKKTSIQVVEYFINYL
jgi:nucleoside-diphosphate-sugar epimerase